MGWRYDNSSVISKVGDFSLIGNRSLAPENEKHFLFGSTLVLCSNSYKNNNKMSLWKKMPAVTFCKVSVSDHAPLILETMTTK